MDLKLYKRRSTIIKYSKIRKRKDTRIYEYVGKMGMK